MSMQVATLDNLKELLESVNKKYQLKKDLNILEITSTASSGILTSEQRDAIINQLNAIHLRRNSVLYVLTQIDYIPGALTPYNQILTFIATDFQNARYQQIVINLYTQGWTYSEIQADITGKLDRYQGTANVGKAMIVGADGILTPTEIPSAEDKLDKNQGASNAGKYMKVGQDGNLSPVSLEVLPQGSAGTALLHNGETWVAQSNYGYQKIIQQPSTKTWDGTISGKDYVQSSILNNIIYTKYVKIAELSQISPISNILIQEYDTEESQWLNFLGQNISKQSFSDVDVYNADIVDDNISITLSTVIAAKAGQHTVTLWEIADQGTVQAQRSLYFPSDGFYVLLVQVKVSEQSIDLIRTKEFTYQSYVQTTKISKEFIPEEPAKSYVDKGTYENNAVPASLKIGGIFLEKIPDYYERNWNE